MADRIRHEVCGAQSAFSWGGVAEDASARWISYRLAHVALAGDPVAHPLAHPSDDGGLDGSAADGGVRR
ncbi:hypothetical protein [Sphingomonas oryzagri]